MAEDFQLPVWGVRPNWSQPVLETLVWLTDVMQSGSGAEQRVALRISPRRTIEARYNPYENERTFVDLAMHRLGRSEWMMPLWFDCSRLTLKASAGNDRLDLATEHHEFFAGGMAYVVGPDTFSGEAVRIAAIDEGGLDLELPLDREWAAGTSVHPMRRGRFESPSHRMLTSRLAETDLRFEVIEGNDLSAEGEWDSLHSDGDPILTIEPEWSQAIEIDLSWLGAEFDPQTGRKRVTDTAGRAFRQQQHNFILCGAREQFEFRQMLYRLRGQQRPIWLSTFADDVTFAAQTNAGGNIIDIEQVGLTYVGGPTDGRNTLRLPTGEFAKIATATSVAGTSIERLTLNGPLTNAVHVGQRASFIEKARLAQDSVEIEHLGDTDGASRSTLSFSAFADRRVATTAVSPIPAAAMNSLYCGSPAIESECTFMPEFEGWYVEFLASWANTEGGPGCFVDCRDAAGNILERSTVSGANLQPDGQSYLIRTTTPESYSAYEYMLRFQFGSGTTNPTSRGTFRVRRWDERNYSQPLPHTWQDDLSGNPFRVSGLYPRNWYFYA